MLRFYLKTPNLDPLFIQLRTAIRDFQLLWPRLKAILQEAIVQQFATEGEAGAHGKWEALEPHYAQIKSRKYPGAGILVAKGTLLGSFFGGPNHYWRSGPLSMAFGSTLPYALFHQMGFLTRLGTGKGGPWKTLATVYGKSFVDARRIMDFSDEVIRELRSAIVYWVQEEYRKMGFRIGSMVPGETVRRISRAEATAAGRAAFAAGASPISL